MLWRGKPALQGLTSLQHTRQIPEVDGRQMLPQKGLWEMVWPPARPPRRETRETGAAGGFGLRSENYFGKSTEEDRLGQRLESGKSPLAAGGWHTPAACR